MTREELETVVISQCGMRTFHETDVYKMFNAHLIIAGQIQTRLEQRIKELEKPKSCEGCKYVILGDDDRTCSHKDLQTYYGISFDVKTFFCSNHSDKDA